MPVIPVGTIIPKKSRVLTDKIKKTVNNDNQPVRRVINSFELQADFVPAAHHKNAHNHAKAGFFIDSII